MPDDLCGADTTHDRPCRNPAGENGRCWIPGHNPDDDRENPGRPSKLTVERQEGMAAMIEQGHSQAAASRAYGISPQTFTEWKRRGEDEPESIYGDFGERIARALAESETGYVNELRHVAGEIQDTATIRWMLQQRHAQSWGESDALGSAAQPIPELSPEEQEAIRDALVPDE